MSDESRCDFCGKVSYPSPQAVWSQVRKMKRQYQGDRRIVGEGGIYTYWCKRGRAWHMSSRRDHRKRRPRRDNDPRAEIDP